MADVGLDATTHRPYAPPTRRWAMSMTWHDLLFLHWPVDPEALRPHVPASFTIDTFDDTAWLGIVPFSMSNVRRRGCPAVPGTTEFPELNVRTYVHRGAKPGVWFFSLDATSALAVRVARLWYHLPYYDARITVAQTGGSWHYTSERIHHGAAPASLVARYHPTGDPFQAAPDSLDAWLTERYCLYTVGRQRRPLRGEIHHEPWPLQPAEAVIATNDMTAQIDVTLPDTPPLCHFAKRLDVVAWTLEPA